ncbi:MAG: peptidase S41, partial [Melioribacteraceae bacterium]|nr:peptidase S41 [Melioribacteraceae bacterium]
MFKSMLLTLLFVSIINSFATDNGLFVRYPDLNSDGSKIVFNFQGDIWVANSDGTDPRRMTIHESYDYVPLWSSDDQFIGFSSNRFGNNDIFRIPAGGGRPERITFHSSGDVLTDYTADDNLLFSTSRTFRQIEWDHELAEVPASGGTPSLLLDAVGEMPVKSPDGRFIAFVKGFGRITREAYRGSADYDIWIYDIKNKTYNKLTEFDGHDVYPRWADSKTLYYLSTEGGTYNVHKIDLDENGNKSGKTTQITKYNVDGPRYFNLSGDNKTLVFERQTDIYTHNLQNGATKKLDIKISSDYRFDPIVQRTFSNKMSQYTVSPNGKYTAFVVRGEIFITENDKEKNRTVNLTDNPYRDQHPAWLNDTSLIFISDREGQQDLYLMRSSDQEESDIFKSLKHELVRLTDTPEDESWPVMSPDLNKVAYEVGRGKLIVADIDSTGEISNSLELLDGWAIPGNVTWSPDSKWLAYSLDDLYFNSEIFIHSADNEIEPINVSMHPRGDYSPAWSKDGSKLGWISSRSNNDADVWFVWLNKEDWERTKEDWDEYEEPKEKKEDKKDKDDKKGKSV